MIQLIAGKKGEGKTKNLIKMANNAVNKTEGHVIYIDKDNSHIYDLNYNIRLITTNDFPMETGKEFFGFICGILSNDFDINYIFIDGLLKTAKIDEKYAISLLHKFKFLAEQYNVKFVVSISCDRSLIPNELKDYLVA